MEKQYLTKEEKELIELLQFMQKFFKDYPATHPKDIEDMPKYIAEWKEEEEIIIALAKSRVEFLEGLETDKYRNKNEVHEVVCLKCNAPSTSKPLKKDFKNKLGINYLSFKCPKCKCIFSFGLGVTDWDTINNMENMIRDLGKMDYDKTALNKMKEDSEKFKQAVIKSDEANQVCLDNHAKTAEWATGQLARFTILKHKFLTNNHTIGES